MDGDRTQRAAANCRVFEGNHLSMISILVVQTVKAKLRWKDD